MAKAKVDALLGSCPASHASLKSGAKCWASFAQRVLGRTSREFPPTADELVAWSRLFSCHGTFMNYVGHTRLACQLIGASEEAFDSPLVKRAKASVKKRSEHIARVKHFITHDMVEKMVVWAETAFDVSDNVWAMLFLATYTFLLRLPSEALPMAMKSSGSHGNEQHSALYLEGDELCLQLRHRKNRPRGGTLRRKCWCKMSEKTCPVHALWPFFLERAGNGEQPFIGARITPAFALMQLRRMLLLALGLKNANEYKTHDARPAPWACQ